MAVRPSVYFQYTEFTQEKAIDINAKVYKSVGLERFGRLVLKGEVFGWCAIPDRYQICREQRLAALLPL